MSTQQTNGARRTLNLSFRSIITLWRSHFSFFLSSFFSSFLRFNAVSPSRPPLLLCASAAHQSPASKRRNLTVRFSQQGAEAGALAAKKALFTHPEILTQRKGKKTKKPTHLCGCVCSLHAAIGVSMLAVISITFLQGSVFPPVGGRDNTRRLTRIGLGRF